MYQWLVFLHIIGVAGFMLSHGTSVAITFKLRTERDPQRVGALIETSNSTMKYFYLSLILLLTGGIGAGFVGHGQWWEKGWMSFSLALLVFTGIAMFAMAKPYYGRVAKAARIQAAGGHPIPGQDLFVLLNSRIPVVIAALGLGSILVILYLMVLKPF